MQSILIAVLGMFAGGAMVGFGIFLYYLTQSVRKLQKTVEDGVSKFDKRSIEQLTASLNSMSQYGPRIVQSLDAVTAVVKVFNSKAFISTEPTAAPAPGDKESGFLFTTETEQAAQYAAQELRKRGIETEEARVPAPAPEQINTAEV